MRRSPIKRRLYRPPRRPEADKVTPELRLAVITRDIHEARQAGIFSHIACAAPIIDRSQVGLCWGDALLDHIKSEPRLGVRAESDMAHLVTLCQGHSEDGRKAGFQWNTANRPALRGYLARVNGAP